MLRRFGIAALRPAQQAALDAVRAGSDVLVILPTGGGKSLCYQLPAVCGACPAVVVSPLVALMKDQVDALRRKGVAAAQVSTAVSTRERDEAWTRLEQGCLSLLYIAPEALASPNARRRLARTTPRLLAIDEAHCISEWGESFRPSYLSLGNVRDAIGAPPTIALTATATPRTARDIVTRLGLRNPIRISGGFDRRNLRLHVRRIEQHGARLTQLLRLGREAPGATVVYACTRRQSEQLAAAYRRAGVSAAPFHAGLSTAERSGLQDDFHANRLALIVATNAFGMGVDKPDVRLVVHAAPPATLEAYYQEAGRAGRDGQLADCVMLFSADDLTRRRSCIVRPGCSPSLLAGVQSLVHCAAVVNLAGTSEGDAVSRIGRALRVSAREVATAVRLLVEGGSITPNRGGGSLRVIATPARLAADRSIPDDVAQALSLLVPARDPAAGALCRSFEWQALRKVAPAGDVADFVSRLQSMQLAVWRPNGAPWRAATLLDAAELERLHRQDVTRVTRNGWRWEQVSRLVLTTRCRRQVLLRYFGDPAPAAPCGACDVCGFDR